MTCLKFIYLFFVLVSCLSTQLIYPLKPELIEYQFTPPLFPFLEKEKLFTTFLYNPLVPADVWTKLEPYFLPDDHPIKEKLDKLFSQIRATQSEALFEKAGFGKAKMRKPTNIVVGKHEQFKDYIFKVYLDTQPPLDEWLNWVQRIEGAHAIQACIARHGFKHFCVPNKWIYPLPLDPSPPKNSRFHRKNFILIAEYMPLVTPKENDRAFKNKITPKILEELYTILTEEGLIDSVYPDNIPFTKNGKIAFIDTEHHYPGRAIPYDKLTPHLSNDMQDYWQTLITR